MEHGSLKDMARAYSQVTDFTNNGVCSKCGNCCSRTLPMTQKEINQIKLYIKKHNIKRQVHMVNVLAGKQVDWVCPFLDNTKANKCTIYEVRPSICREFNCHDYITLRIFNNPHETKERIKRDALKTFFFR